MEKPDKWIVIKIEDGLYKVLASWYGGYLDGDYWKLNSGIVSVSDEGDWFDFLGESGSIYRCHKRAYGTSMFTRGFLNEMIEESLSTGNIIDVMPEDTDWEKLF